VELYTLSPADHSLKAAWFQPLNVSGETPVSKVAFKLNLYRYGPVRHRG
jgi:hypothetical protein